MSEINDITVKHRNNFDEEMRNLLENKTKTNLFTKSRYDEIIDEYSRVKEKKFTDKKTLNNREKYLLKKYKLLQSKTDNTKRLVSNDDNEKYFVHVEELFDILNDLHYELNHCGVKKMYDHLRYKYMNITMEAIRIFIQNCEHCRMEKNIKEIDTTKFSKWLIGFIDMSDFNKSNDNNSYRFIMKYQDARTRFCVFKAIKNDSPAMVAEILREIFGYFGAPQILSCENGSSQVFIGNVKEKLREYYDKNLKIITGKESADSDYDTDFAGLIKKIVKNLCENRKIENWFSVMPELQFIVNTIEDEQYNCTPYERFFSRKPNFGLDFHLPDSFNLEDLIEEKLEQFCVQQLSDSILKSPKTSTSPSSSFDDSAIIVFDQNSTTSSESDEFTLQSHCRCKSGCKTNRCSCKSSNNHCNILCHPNYDQLCENDAAQRKKTLNLNL